MPSPSAIIRQTIPGYKRGLLSKLDIADGLLKQDTDDDDASISILEHLQRQLVVAKTGIQQSINNLREQDRMWQQALAAVTDDALHASECQEYERTAVSDDTGYIPLIEKAQDVCLHIDLQVSTLHGLMQTVTASHSNESRSTAQASNDRSSPAATDPTRSRMTVKHPKFELPTFDGDFLRWNEFWSIFSATVHDDPTLTQLQKFSYLLSKLQGKARMAIEGLLMSDDNYAVAIDILRQRFDQGSERLVSMLYGELKRLPRCGKQRDAKRRTYDACEKMFRQLEQAGEDINSNRALTFDLLSKFPPGMVRDLQRHYHVSVYSELNEVRKAINDSVTELETTADVLDDLDSLNFRSSSPQADMHHSEPPRSKQFERRSPNSNRARNHPNSSHPKPIEFHRSNSTFATVSRPGPTQRPPTPSSPSSNCYFCDGPHFNSECPRYTSAVAREKRLRELKRCVRCGRNHPGADIGRCYIRIKCFHCQSHNDHYGPLCKIRYPAHSSQSQSRGSAPNPSPRPSNSNAHSQQRQHSSSSNSPSITGVTVMSAESKRKTYALFQTACTQAVNLETGETCRVRLSLDTLSSESYITAAKADQLNLRSSCSEIASVNVFASEQTSQIAKQFVRFGLVLSDGSVAEIGGNKVSVISPADVIPSAWPECEYKLLDSFRHQLADDPDDPVKTLDVLIGTDYTWDFVLGARLSTDSRISFIPTKFGLMWSGNLPISSDVAMVQPTMLCLNPSRNAVSSELGMVAASCGAPTHVHDLADVDAFWNLETIGITECPVQDDDELALQRFNDTVYYDKGRYQVSWPWIDDMQAKLPTNYDVAVRRFKWLSNKLSSDEQLLQSYRDVLNQQLERGIVEQVPPDQIETSNPVHYLPHHPVIRNSSSTTKIRLVYDASARSNKNSVCLNDCLQRGPIMLPDLCHILMRFRSHKTVVISDLEKAFLMVSLQPNDRDVTRFLWFSDDSVPQYSPANLSVFRFCRVPFGIKSSPFLLAATIQYHLRSEGTSLSKQLSRDIYVDNLVSGVDHMQPLQYYRQVKDIFKRAGMNLQEFCSNSKSFMHSIPETDRVQCTDVKMLGLKWDSTNDDTIRITLPVKWDILVTLNTKRGVLQTLASIFDPVGYFQPVLFPAKVLLQQLWITNAQWDTELSPDMNETWQSCKAAIEPIFDFRIPRHIGQVNSESSLIIFSDASKSGYGTAVYLRTRDPRGDWQCNLLFAKSRLAPTNKKSNKGRSITIPRLELLGATIAASSGQFCRDAFDQPMRIHFFIDSSCVLFWLRSPRPLKRFVDRRVQSIRAVDDCEFRFVSTHDNPADYLTRGKTASELINDSLWWHGPQWLVSDQSQWPETQVPPINDAAIREISEPKPVNICHAAPVVQAVDTNGPFNVDSSRHSKLHRLLRVTCIAAKFFKSVVWHRLTPAQQNRFRFRSYIDAMSSNPTITASDVDAALSMWICHIQALHYHDLFTAVKQGKKHALVQQLGVRVDDFGFLRCCGRLSRADLPDDAKFPLLLPKSDHFTALVILDAHHRMRHCGESQTLAELRQKFWVPHGRSAVRKVTSRCTTCRKLKTGVPFALPDMPAWPLERVSKSAPFQFVGIDYFGPIKVKVNNNICKMWVCLFACLSTRAIHLEPVSDCTTGEFLKSLIRFVSRRGQPQMIISDNAGQFHLTKILADRAWQPIQHDDDVLSYLSSTGITWNFIVELAPWQGGHYERLVGVVKSTLKTSISRRIPSWTDFVTLLCETEAIVNSRPITYISHDVDSQFQVLRPVDFLLFRPIGMPDSDSDFPVRDLGESGKQLASLWKQRSKHLQRVWTRWYSEYLLSLRERANTSHRNRRGSVLRSPREGEVVLLRDDDVPRGSWKLARITRLVVSSDEKVRAVELLLPSGYKIRRAVSFVYPLEIDSATHVDTVPETNDQADVTGVDDDSDFLGFSDVDIQRTADALQRFDYVSDDNDSDCESDRQ